MMEETAAILPFKTATVNDFSRQNLVTELVGKVVQLDEKRPYCSGDALCLDCKAQWVAVAPIYTQWLDCPKCGLVRGRFKYPFIREPMLFTCTCGNDLFQFHPNGPYCPNCNAWIHPDPPPLKPVA